MSLKKKLDLAEWLYKNKKSLWKKGKELIRGKPYQKEGKNKLEKIKSITNKKNIGPNAKELAKDVVRYKAAEKVIWDPAFKALDKYPEYKKGGAVKKCRMDGIALRGKTRAKERSK